MCIWKVFGPYNWGLEDFGCHTKYARLVWEWYAMAPMMMNCSIRNIHFTVAFKLSTTGIRFSCRATCDIGIEGFLEKELKSMTALLTSFNESTFIMSDQARLNDKEAFHILLVRNIDDLFPLAGNLFHGHLWQPRKAVLQYVCNASLYIQSFSLT